MSLGICSVNNKHLKLVMIFSSLSLLMALISCNKDNKKITLKTENNFKQKTISTNNDFLIYKKGVSDIKIGENLPEKTNKYEYIKSHKLVEEGNVEPIVKILHNKDTLFEVSFVYELENQNFNDKISEILIKSQKFKTKENIGVTSTIEDFIKEYTNYFIWYTYISNNYVIQSKDLEIQFLLNEEDYIGKKDLMSGDMVELELTDFKPYSKIKAIRIF